MEHRTLIDSEGTVWDVWEVQPAANEKRRDPHPTPPEGQVVVADARALAYGR